MTVTEKQIFNTQYKEINNNIVKLKGLIDSLTKERDCKIDEHCIFVSLNIQKQIDDYQKQLEKLIYCKSVLDSLYKKILMQL